MRLIQPVLVGASLINALDSINYQKVGQCGIPAKGFNDDGDTMLWSDVNRKKRSTFGDFTTPSPSTNETSGGASPLRIVGGTTAKASAWPWQIHLAVCGKWYGSLECNICGGSLIHPRFVISAAHCVPDEAAGNIILGASNVAKGGTQRVPVDKWIKHPRWGERGGALFDHDIAILRLGQAAQMSSQVSPICLPSDDSCFATGTVSTENPHFKTAFYKNHFNFLAMCCNWMGSLIRNRWIPRTASASFGPSHETR